MEIVDVIVQGIEAVTASPWFLPLLFWLAALDAVLPAVPSETVVITAGVVVATGAGGLDLFLVVAVAAAGAFVGDHLSYLLGRRAGRGLLATTPTGSRRRAAYDWAVREMVRHGGRTLVAARFVPGGRTAVTATAGALRYPLWRFSSFAGLGAVAWALYAGLVGYVGGIAFQDDPVRGLLLGSGIALGITGLVEVLRHLDGERRRPAAVPGLRG